LTCGLKTPTGLFLFYMKDEEIKILFTQTRYERALERDMTLVPNFKPRGNVVIVMSRFKYTAEMCLCVSQYLLNL
jgi:hypothetical protein